MTPTVIGSPTLAILRLAMFLALTVAVAPVQAMALMFRLRLASRLPRRYHALCARICGIRIEVHGRMSPARPVLFVGNHSSYLDIIVYGALIEGSFVAKAEVRGWPLFGLLAVMQRTVFITRKRQRAQKHIKKVQRRLEAGDNLILFPEGTSNDGNHVLPFKSSLFSVAQMRAHDAPLTVQPVTVDYARLDGMPIGRHLRPYFAWYGDMTLAPHMLRMLGLGRTTVVVTFHEPVTYDQFGSRKALAQHCWRAVAQGRQGPISPVSMAANASRRPPNDPPPGPGLP